LLELNANEDQNHEPEADEQADDARVVPGVVSAAPLQSEQQTNDGGNEDGGAEQIELQNALHPRLAVGIVTGLDVEEEEDDGHGNAAEGQVDVEAPSPGCVVGEGASEEGAGDGLHTTSDNAPRDGEGGQNTQQFPTCRRWRRMRWAAS
jgi:hypothetical protein